VPAGGLLSSHGVGNRTTQADIGQVRLPGRPELFDQSQQYHQGARGVIPLNRRILPPMLAALSCAMVLTLWACAPATTVVTPALYGAALEPAVKLPQLTFTRTDGGSFSTADTRDRISLFFFGYMVLIWRRRLRHTGVCQALPWK
jgi:hypothetical protein